MRKIKVQGAEISIWSINEDDYISLTGMVKGIENGSALIEKWLRNKNTIEFLGIWEEMYNPDFNSTEFGGIKNEAGKISTGKVKRAYRGGQIPSRGLGFSLQGTSPFPAGAQIEL